MLTRHLVAVIAILAVALIGPTMLPGKSKIAATDLPPLEKLTPIQAESS